MLLCLDSLKHVLDCAPFCIFHCHHMEQIELKSPWGLGTGSSLFYLEKIVHKSNSMPCTYLYQVNGPNSTNKNIAECS